MLNRKLRMMNFGFALTLALGAMTTTAEASSCMPKGREENGKFLLERGEKTYALQNSVSKFLKRKGSEHSIAFVRVDEDYDVKDQTIVDLKEDGYKTQIPSNVLGKLEKGERILIIQRGDSEGFILPGSPETLKKTFDPEKDCKAALSADRFFAARAVGYAETSEHTRVKVACDAVNLSGLTEATIAYGPAARACKDVTQVLKTSKSQRSQSQAQVLKEQIENLEKKFGSASRTGENRTPAGIKQNPIVTSKKDPAQEIGSSKPRTGKNSKTGN